MKKIILLGVICITLISISKESFSMSSKRMTEKKEVVGAEMETSLKKEEGSKEVTSTKKTVVEPLEQPDIILNEKTIVGLYEEISEKPQNTSLRKYPAGYMEDTYEVYTGEKLEIQSVEPIKVRLIKFPYMSENEISIKKNVVYFETHYQGEYQIEIEDNIGNKRNIEVKSKHKYNFTEEQNYDIILNSYKNRTLDVFVASKNLFILSYGDSFKIKDILFMDAQLNIDLKNYGEAKKSIKKIETTYQLTESEKEELILLEEKTLLKGSVLRKNYLYKNKEIGDLNEELLATFNVGDRINLRDLEFLKEEYKKNPSSKTAQIIGDQYATDYSINGSSGDAIKYLTYAQDYGKIANIYLEEREFELFKKILLKVDGSSKGKLLEKEKKLLKTIEVEKEINLGRERFESENYQEAILFFDRAKRKNDAIAKALGVELDLGISYYNLFDYEKAVIHLKKIKGIAKNPYKLLEADYYIAMSYYRNEEPEESLVYFDKIVKDYPETSWAKKSMIYIIRLRKEKIEEGEL